MNLLICTQIVDSQDSNLGFFHRWIEEFAKHCDKVTVICLKEGSHVLPENVTVLSLGKPSFAKATKGTGMHRRMQYAVRFLKYIYQERNNYDAVLVHMNPEYVLLGGYLWKRWGKNVGLWYAHTSVTRKLRYAVKLVDRVFTVSEDSFGIHTPKLIALGHGIDTELFNPTLHQESTGTRFITVGRVAGSKHLFEMLEMFDALHAHGEKFTFTVVGIPTSPKEEEYAARLYEEAKKRPYSDRVHFLGSVPHHELPELLHTHDVALNFGGTGNMDKAGLEALAVGIPVFTTNRAFAAMLEPYGLFTPTMAGETAAATLTKFLNRSDRPSIVATLRNKVMAEHSLKNLIPKILKELA
jgi:glycosyltransferase involved in cell wall biosynthesis